MNHLRTIVSTNTKNRLLTKQRTATILACVIGIMLVGCNSGTAKAEQTDDIASIANQTATNLQSDDSVVAALKANMEASGIEQRIDSAVPTSMPNMYWVSAPGMQSFFTDSEGKYVIQGQVIELGAEQPVDISANLKAEAAQDLLAKVDKTDMVIYPALGETKAVVYAFTDADCGYCRKLHSEMQDINSKGVEVRYLAWPRSDKTKPKMESIWCSEDRNRAMNIAKAGGNVTAKSCNNPVTEQVDLGFNLGVNGTPAIFTTSGANIGGYLPANQLVKAAISNQ